MFDEQKARLRQELAEIRKRNGMRPYRAKCGEKHRGMFCFHGELAFYQSQESLRPTTTGITCPSCGGTGFRA